MCILAASTERSGERHYTMKRGLLTAFRALVFAVCVFLLATVGGLKIKSGGAVAAFVLGIAAFWVLIETVMMSMMKKKKTKTRPF